jgi:glycosyltransferase involved in cell wall biosynthesis
VEGSEVTRTIATDAKRVLFDARPAESGVTGIARYARTLGTLMKGVPGHFCWTLGQDLKWKPATPFEEELELPYILEREEIDVFHSPLFHLPAVLPCKSIVTIHDAIPLVRPELSSPGFTRLFKEQAVEAVTRADRVVCPTEHAKEDLVRALHVAPEKIHVITETPEPHFRVLERKREPEFFLVVGSLEPRKNPLVVLDALTHFPRSHSPRVVFVGPAAGVDVTEQARRRGVEDSVRWLGAVSEEELVQLYNDAIALIFPSLYEGFGLPVVEAFACGTPVIASSASSVPEVAGDAAILFDPSDASALASAMRSLTPERAVDLRKRGFERLEAFSKERVCDQLALLYSELET